MKIALFGAGGQLAHDLIRELAEHELVPLARTDVDIADEAAVEGALKAHRPDLVINAAAYNALGPRALARQTESLRIPIAHFSTDYVFGRESKATGWLETDAPGPTSAYGVSKLAGEHFVAAHNPRHFILRTCGLYGLKGSRGKGGNIAETFLRLAAGPGPMRVVSDQCCTPTSTALVARLTRALLTTEAWGLYHVTAAGGVSWHGFASEIIRLTGRNTPCEAIPTSAFPRPARRPPWSVLDTGKLSRVIGQPIPDWRTTLAAYLSSRPDAG
jgi:dTDP-4-dehydrorhamnose reductase